MSDNTQTPVAVVPTQETDTPESKQSFLDKSKSLISRHKRPALAVGALVALVGAAALAGRKTAPDAEVFVVSVVEDDEPEDSENDTETA